MSSKLPYISLLLVAYCISLFLIQSVYWLSITGTVVHEPKTSSIRLSKEEAKELLDNKYDDYWVYYSEITTQTKVSRGKFPFIIIKTDTLDYSIRNHIF